MTAPQAGRVLPFQPDEIRVVTKAGKPTEVILTVEQFQQLLDLIDDLDDRADYIAFREAPARDFEDFLREL